MIIQPYIVYGFATDKQLEGGEGFDTGLTQYNGKLVYFVNKTDIVAQNITVNERLINFNKFALYHNKVPGWMLAIVGDLSFD
jgi:hypothetical protein